MRSAIIKRACSQSIEQLEQWRDRVLGFFRIGDVTLAPLHRDHTVQAAATTNLDGVAKMSRIGWFTDQAVIQALSGLGNGLEQFLRAVDRRAFFIAGDQKSDGAFRMATFGQITRHTGDHRGERALHVRSSAPPEDTFLQCGIKRGVGPAVFRARGNHIGMTGKAEDRPFCPQPRVEIIHLIKGVARNAEPKGLKRIAKHVQRPGIHRCHRGSLNKRAGQRNGIGEVWGWARVFHGSHIGLIGALRHAPSDIIAGAGKSRSSARGERQCV